MTIRFTKLTIAHANPFASEASLASKPEMDYFTAQIELKHRTHYGDNDLKMALPVDAAEALVALVAELVMTGAKDVSDAIAASAMSIPRVAQTVQALAIADAAVRFDEPLSPPMSPPAAPAPPVDDDLNF